VGLHWTNDLPVSSLPFAYTQAVSTNTLKHASFEIETFAR
jgi:hypothetical protein